MEALYPTGLFAIIIQNSMVLVLETRTNYSWREVEEVNFENYVNTHMWISIKVSQYFDFLHTLCICVPVIFQYTELFLNIIMVLSLVLSNPGILSQKYVSTGKCEMDLTDYSHTWAITIFVLPIKIYINIWLSTQLCTLWFNRVYNLYYSLIHYLCTVK